MADGLMVLGIEAQPQADGIVIQGGELGGGVIESHGDHRTAMAFSIASLCATREIRINECANVNTSFPGFVELANQIGIRITDDA
jgi:3-phosphoshikimate 1-carboxyvinyltransferase